MYFLPTCLHFWCSLFLPEDSSFICCHVLSAWKTYFTISYNVFWLARDYLGFSLSENVNQLIKILNQFAHTPLKKNPYILHCGRDIYFPQNIQDLLIFLNPLAIRQVMSSVNLLLLGKTFKIRYEVSTSDLAL